MLWLVTAARIGLVLGAGGPVGHAFHAGVVRALHESLSWDARDATVGVGTSEGAQVGALLRAGMSSQDVAARASGRPLTPAGDAIARHYTRPNHDTPRSKSGYKPSSPQYLQSVARRPWTARLGPLVSALLPEGHVPMHTQASGLKRLFGDRWPVRHLWITAVHLESGSRVAFGAPGAPKTDVGTAVTCSGAVPGICQPVLVEDRRYVDGGIFSPTHLDLLGDEKLDLVIVSSPLSMFAPMRFLLRAEMKALAQRGVRSVAFEPKGSVLRAMGMNPMALWRSARVAHAAYEHARREVDCVVMRPLRDAL